MDTYTPENDIGNNIHCHSVAMPISVWREIYPIEILPSEGRMKRTYFQGENAKPAGVFDGGGTLVHDRPLVRHYCGWDLYCHSSISGDGAGEAIKKR